MEPQETYTGVNKTYKPNGDEQIMPEELSKLLKTALPDYDVPFGRSDEKFIEILRKLDQL